MASRPSPCRSTLKPSPCRLPAVMTSIRIDSIAAGFHHGGALMHPSIRCRGAGKQSARNRELGPQVVPPSPAQSLQSRCHQRPRSRGLVLAHRRSSIGAADLAPQTPETPLCDDAVTNAAAGDKNVHAAATTSGARTSTASHTVTNVDRPAPPFWRSPHNVASDRCDTVSLLDDGAELTAALASVTAGASRRHRKPGLNGATTESRAVTRPTRVGNLPIASFATVALRLTIDPFESSA